MEPTRISVEDAKAKFDRGDRVAFLDTRSPESWEKSDVRLPGALRVPPDEVADHLADISRDREIVTYCT